MSPYPKKRSKKAAGRPFRKKGQNPNSKWIWGKHPVEEALGSKQVRVLQVWILEEKKETKVAEELKKTIGRNGANLRWVRSRELEKISNGRDHQGIAAKVVDKSFKDLDSFLESLGEEEKKGLILAALDQIQDPQNYGAILRSAAGLGVSAVINPDRRSAPMSDAVLRVSAGAAQRVPTFRVSNLAQTLLKLKEEGFWVYGADMDGTPAWNAKLNRPMVLVVGSEGKGIRSLIKSYCDEVVSVPLAAEGPESLNASCAASVLFYEAARQGR